MRTPGSKQSGQKLSGWLWLPGLLLAAVAVALVGGKLYTDAIVRAAEAKYPPTDFVTVEGVRLHYFKAGSGPSVVILHGSGGKLQDFAFSPLLELLKAEYQVVIFDRPGLGYSQKPAGEEVTPAVQARLLHQAVEQLGLEQPVLVGQSWGGVIALVFAREYPNDVSGLVLLGASPYPRERPLPFFDKIALLPVVGDVMLQTLYVPIGRHWIAPEVLVQNKDYFAPLETVPQAYYDSTLALGLRPTHLKASAREKLIIPPHLPAVVDGLEEIRTPVIIVAGGQDHHALDVVPRLHQDLPVSRVTLVEDANHFLWFPYPEMVLDAVREVSAWASELSNT